MLLHTALRPEQVIASPNIIETKKVKKIRQKNLFPMKRKTLKKQTMRQINTLPDKEFKALVIGMPTELEGITYECSENFKKELENIKKNQSELSNTITKPNNTL